MMLKFHKNQLLAIYLLKSALNVLFKKDIFFYNISSQFRKTDILSSLLSSYFQTHM